MISLSIHTGRFFRLIHESLLKALRGLVDCLVVACHVELDNLLRLDVDIICGLVIAVRTLVAASLRFTLSIAILKVLVTHLLVTLPRDVFLSSRTPCPLIVSIGISIVVEARSANLIDYLVAIRIVNLMNRRRILFQMWWRQLQLIGVHKECFGFDVDALAHKVSVVDIVFLHKGSQVSLHIERGVVVGAASLPMLPWRAFHNGRISLMELYLGKILGKRRVHGLVASIVHDLNRVLPSVLE